MSLFKDMFNDFLPSLSEKENLIFNFISSNFTHVANMDIKELSLKLEVSEYSINKFCKKINVDNFSNLTSILKELSKTSISKSNFLFKNSSEIFLKFLNNINENQIMEICKLILKYKSISILHSNFSKIVADYLEQNFKALNLEVKKFSSARQILKNKNSQLVIYITDYSEKENTQKNLNHLNNKITIVISETIIKKIHDMSSTFILIENNKHFKTFNIFSNSLYFLFVDLLTSKMIELINKI